MPDGKEHTKLSKSQNRSRAEVVVPHFPGLYTGVPAAATQALNPPGPRAGVLCPLCNFRVVPFLSGPGLLNCKLWVPPPSEAWVSGEPGLRAALGYKGTHAPQQSAGPPACQQPRAGSRPTKGAPRGSTMRPRQRQGLVGQACRAPGRRLHLDPLLAAPRPPPRGAREAKEERPPPWAEGAGPSDAGGDRRVPGWRAGAQERTCP